MRRGWNIHEMSPETLSNWHRSVVETKKEMKFALNLYWKRMCMTIAYTNRSFVFSYSKKLLLTRKLWINLEHVIVHLFIVMKFPKRNLIINFYCPSNLECLEIYWLLQLKYLNKLKLILHNQFRVSPTKQHPVCFFSLHGVQKEN